MYTLFKSLVLRIMKTPTEPPDPPAGSHDSVLIYRASPGFLTYSLLLFYLLSLLSYLFPLLLVGIGLINQELPPLIIGLCAAPLLAVIQFCIYFGIRIDYDMRYYIVTDRSLRVREGALIVKEKTISFANVQNMRVVQGPLLRYFGIWHLKVDTAGGGAVEKGQPGGNPHQVQMAGIENAHEVRDLILKHVKARGAGTGLGDVDDDRDEVTRRPLITSSEMVSALRDLKQATAALRSTAETA
jgi:membrane protein YdbS with pleckstrin-like domain